MWLRTMTADYLNTVSKTYHRCPRRIIWANYNDQPAEVTPNGGLVRESPQKSLNSGLGIIVICPEFCYLTGLKYCEWNAVLFKGPKPSKTHEGSNKNTKDALQPRSCQCCLGLCAAGGEERISICSYRSAWSWFGLKESSNNRDDS